jgi:hypothetical protein
MQRTIEKLKADNTAVTHLLTSNRRVISGLLTAAFYGLAVLFLGVPLWKAGVVAAVAFVAAVTGSHQNELRTGSLILMAFGLGVWTELLPR